MTEYFDIQFRIGRRSGPGKPFPVKVTINDGRIIKGQLAYSPPSPYQLEFSPFAIDKKIVAEQLSAALFQPDITDLVTQVTQDWSASNLSTFVMGIRILFQLDAAELYPLPWELIRLYPCDGRKLLSVCNHI